MSSALLDEAAAGLGIDLANSDQVRDLAAVAMARLAWRDGPVEDWHAAPHRRISNGEMMRANAATTRELRAVLESAAVGMTFGDDAGKRDAPFAAVGRVLADPSRCLPDGRTVAELAPDAVQLAAFEHHVWTFCTRWSWVATEYGTPETMALLAVYAGRYCWRWWLAPRWPVLVDEFISRLNDPARWQSLAMMNLVARVGPPDVGDGRDLRELLLAGPDRLGATAAAHCLRAGLGCLLPQDCGLRPLPRRALPTDHLHLVDFPAFILRERSATE